MARTISVAVGLGGVEGGGELMSMRKLRWWLDPVDGEHGGRRVYASCGHDQDLPDSTATTTALF
jgi:hypothetical protein